MKKFVKNILAATCIGLAPLFLTGATAIVEAAPANVTMDSYAQLVNRTSLSRLSSADILEIKRTAPELEEISN